MCGIAGTIGPGGSRELLEAMVESLAHRGPDGSGFFYADDVFLGHRRLSVIDLESGDQPMAAADGSLQLIYNGEIYNFRQLRGQLEELGFGFRTHSDTETLLQGYRAWGLDLLPRLDGIFAFALWDNESRRLILARDLFGVKPLHYHFDGVTLRFASEAKAILRDPRVPRQIDFQALHWLLNLRYIPGERTLFANIRRLLPGHILIYEAGEIRIERKLEIGPIADGPALSLPEYAEGIRHHLREAVRKQLVSDVPLGLYLSGGLDSSALTAMASELTGTSLPTFSLGFDEPTDELEDARIVARRFATEHHEATLEANPLREYPRAIWFAEEPKENILQGFLLARLARRRVKVVLSGLGGDELFTGYLLHRFLYFAEPWRRWIPGALDSWLAKPLSHLLFTLQNRPWLEELGLYRRGGQLLLALGDPCRYYSILRNVWDVDAAALDQIYGPAWKGRQPTPVREVLAPFFSTYGHLVDQAMWTELHTKLVDDFLLNEDRTSMSHGLEIRVPFLDRDLVRYAMSIPAEIKMKGGRTKYLFRHAMSPFLPEHTLKKKKWGFTFDPYYQFQKDLRPLARRVLTRKKVESRGIFRYDFLKRIIDHPPSPRLRWHYFFLWLAFGLEIWIQMYLEGDLEQPSFDVEAYCEQ